MVAKPSDPDSRTARSPHSLRTWAALLVLSAVVPLLIFGGIILWWMAQRHADTFTQTQTDTVRVLASAVDGEIRAWKAVVTTLAQSPALQRDQFGEFSQEAKAVAAQYDGWIVLTDPSGQQHLNTLRPYGTALPTTSAPDLLQAVVTQAQPVVSDVVFGKVAQRWLVAVAVPVVRAGTVAYMLDMSFPADRLTALLKRPALPAAWTLVVFDSQQRVVTRLPLTEERMGKLTQPWVAAALRSGERGTATGIDVRGVAHRVAFQRLSEAPWAVTVSIPVAAFPSPRPIYWFLALGVLLVGAALVTAIFASRKLTGPVGTLAADAERVLHGEAVPAGPATGVREIAQLRQALAAAGTSVRSAMQAREEAADALRRANETLEAQVAERTAQLTQANADLQEANLRLEESNVQLEEEVQERQRAEVALRDSEERLRVTLTSIGDAVLATDGEGRLTFLNPTAEALTGWTQAEAAGQAIGRVFRIINERTREAAEDLVARVLREGTVVTLANQTALLTRDGREIPIEDSAAPIRGATDEVRGVVVVFHDVTVKRRAQAAQDRLAAIVTTSEDAILSKGLDGRILTWNAAAERMLGYPPEEIIGQPVTLLLPPDRLGEEEEILRRLRQGEIVAPFETVRLTKAGRPVPVLLTVSPLKDADGTVVGASKILHDITAHKQAEEALQQALADKDALLREVHHRVKNNLQMLCDLMFLQMEAMPDRDQHPDLQDAYGRIFAIARLHEQLHQTMHGGQIQLAEYLRRLVTGFANLYPDVPVIVEAASDGVLLDLDRAIHVGLIVNELLTNAIKHAFPVGQPGAVSVSVCEETERIYLQVRDNGRGLPADFDLEHAKSLGLRTVHLLARRLEAQVAVTSNGGTSFTLTFPVHADPPLEPK